MAGYPRMRDDLKGAGRLAHWTGSTALGLAGIVLILVMAGGIMVSLIALAWMIVSRV